MHNPYDELEKRIEKYHKDSHDLKRQLDAIRRLSVYIKQRKVREVK